MNISFIIITNGLKPQELDLQIKSIEYQRIPNYEIVLVGKIDPKFKNKNTIKVIQDHFNAERGSLGGMRNKGVENSIYENLVISDDDMLFSKNWYKNLIQNKNFDILTTCIKSPDGTRFWDNACYMSPQRGHIILNPDETDDHLYMSGGQSWIIKKEICNKVKWNEELLIYKMKNLDDYNKGLHNEDTDFALRCRENNYKITYDHNTLVYHNDKSYTSIGRVVRRRLNKKSFDWCLSFDFPEKITLEFALNLVNYGFHAEGADLLRKLILTEQSFLAENTLNQIEEKLGGKLIDSNFSFNNEEYKDLINTYQHVQ